VSESHNERMARRKRERAEHLRQVADDAALAEKLNNDPEFAKDFDESFVKGFTGMEDDIIENFAKEQGYSKDEKEAMRRTVKRARQTAKGGFLTSGDPAKAEEILMSNRGIREMRKQKSEKSCFLAALVLLAFLGSTVGAAVWGAAGALAAVLN
jgi:VIT1/CCC1 family predicted Fe2+/Mn2+ transporter